MKKFNEKGMAISGILYTILVLFIVLLFGILSLLSASKYTFDKIKSDVVDKIDGTQAAGVTANSCFEFDYSTGAITNYNNTSPICGTDVVIPESIDNVLVKSIAAKAFYNKKLTSVDFSRAVYLENIADGTYVTGAFGNNAIKKVVFGKNRALTNIGKFAFYGNQIGNVLNLSTLTALKTIGEASFYSNKITGVDFSNLLQLTSIGQGAFYGNIIAGELDFSSLNSLTTIGPWSFASNLITSVNTTNLVNLKTIDQYAFNQNSLEDFDFRNTTSLNSIGVRAFALNQLQNVDLSNTVVKHINDNAFSDNVITEVKFNSGVTKIGKYAFSRNNITGLLDLSTLNLTTFDNYAFFSNKITGVKFNGATISEGAFANNKITSLDFNNLPNVTAIKNAAFYNNDTLTSVNFRNKPISEIGSISFANCGITSLAIPSAVTTIGDSAFANNKIAGTLDLTGNTDLSIAALAFYNNKITDIKLPTYLTSIGGGAFNLNNVSNDANKVIYARNDDGTENKGLVISYAGAGGAHIEIPSDVTGVASYAFQNINAEDLVFGENIENIDDYAFAGFRISGALDLSAMKNLRSIGESSFTSNCYSKVITYSETLSETTSQSNNVKYKYKKYNTVTITSNTYEETTGITSINFTGLTKLESIGKNAFSNNSSLTKLIGLEDLVSLTTVGESAFNGNWINTDINLGNTKLEIIPSHAFRSDLSKGGSASGKLTLPDTVTYVGKHAFRNLRHAEVKLSANLKQIDDYGFHGNRYSIIDFPEGLETIGQYAFVGNLFVNLEFPSTLKSIGNAVFQGMSTLKSVDFSKTGPDFKKIPNLTFHTCSNLSDIKLGNYIESISVSAFTYCNYTDLVIPASVKYMSRGSFTNSRSTVKSVTVLSNSTNLDSRFDNDWVKIGWPANLKSDYASETYTLSTTEENSFDYIGKPYKVVIPKTGKYKLEVWGAQGGDFSTTYVGGKGGYSTGEINLNKDDIIYVFVGGQPGTNLISSEYFAGGFNGGGYGYKQTEANLYLGGGGATDVRIGSQSTYARVIVAGGGSGASAYNSGYAGGGTTSLGYGDYIANQTKAGTNGGFGYSGNAVYTYTATSKTSSGGGGGWYGGGAQGESSGANGDTSIKMTGGGSGYIYTSSTASNYPSGCLLTSSHYLTNTKITAGNASMPKHDASGNMTGNTGNGFAKITFIS